MKTHMIRVSQLSTYVPRECGLATYAYDLCSSCNKSKIIEPIKIMAINDHEATYDYPHEVKMQIDEKNFKAYMYAADIINEYSDLLHIQHEYGIFGGAGGGYLVSFLKKIHIPVVVTFHTMLSKPTKLLHKVTKQIAAHCEGIVVMSEYAKTILKKVYGIEKKKVHVIHHGVHDMEYKASNEVKDRLNLKNKIVLMTFGLINQGKGIEYVIEALPRLVKEFPELIYLVIGETHPDVRIKEGEIYRHKLMKMVDSLGLVNHVKFQNRYLTLQEVLTYLHVSDIYITPYIYSEQVCSGTLAYAIGSGKAIVSTPYVYAQEMLKGGRGVFVKAKDVISIYKKIRLLIKNPQLREEISWNAYQLGREMTWACVGKKHIELYLQLFQDHNSFLAKPQIRETISSTLSF
ncbi:glycosyltransferase family 4 protein [Chlamydiota bacterium]